VRSAGVIVRTFIAMGDSFTSGSDPDVEPWADEVARVLSVAHYQNLARPGSRSEEIVAEQLPPALAAQPDLVSLVCGANDVITTTRPDLRGFALHFDYALRQLRSELPEAALFTATYPDVSVHSALRPRSRERIGNGLRALNEAIRRAAYLNGVVCLDYAEKPQRSQRDLFTDDGFHPSPTGHRKVAQAFGRALREHGVELDLEEAEA
jgi:lysophospholipase L1-like esterase